MEDSTEFSQLQSQKFLNATAVIQINIKSCCLIYLTSGFRRSSLHEISKKMKSHNSWTVWTQLAYLFKWRTAIPLGALFCYPTFPWGSDYSITVAIYVTINALSASRVIPPFGAYLMKWPKSLQSVVRGDACLDHWHKVFTAVFGPHVKPRQCIR